MSKHHIKNMAASHPVANWMPQPLRNVFHIIGILIGCFGLAEARADDVVWDGGATGNGTAWTTASNWNPDGVPAAGDNAIIDSVGSAADIFFSLTPATATQQVGSVTMASGRLGSLVIRNSNATGTTNGILWLNGVGGVVLSNASPSGELNFQYSSGSNNKLLELGLTTDGIIHASGSSGGGAAGRITISSTISEVGGSRGITKVGPGVLYLRGTNSYTGSTTVLAGDVAVDDVGTIGDGTGILYLSGGNLQSGASRTTSHVPVANPIVVTADAYIQNTSGNANPRYLPLSGTLTGTGGTLKIADPTTAAGNTFAVRLLNPAINFDRPMVVGVLGYDLAGTTCVMDSCNTNGTQTFSGNISGTGIIRRSNVYAPGGAAGTTILTGNNSYEGGTTITEGTMLANNSAGSALGSGPVAVTGSTAILGGNGTVTASTTVSTNGTLSPGTNATHIANLGISDLTLGVGANYVWQISSVSGTAGVNWDLITCSSGWTDAADSVTPITIKVDSLGATPTGWNPGTAQDWVIIQSSSATGFDASHFAIDTTAFAPGSAQGAFSLSVVSGSLHLIYTPATDIVINVPSGSVAQGGTTPTPYPILTGNFGVVKVGDGEVILTNSLNDYVGSTKVYAGTATLAVDALNGSGALGSGSSALLLGNTTGSSNATLNLNTDGVTMARAVTVQSGSSGSKTLGTTLTSGTATFSGGVTLQDSATFTAPTGGTAVFSGNVTGAGELALSGGGTLTLAAVNSYAGPTTTSCTQLNLNDKGLGTNTVTISSPLVLDNTGAGSVTLNASPQNWNADFTFLGTQNLNLGAGPVTMSAGRTLTVNASTLTVGGTISGNGGLTKLGAGTLALTSATNTYTGGTTNSAGVLAVNATTSLGDGAGTLLLNGGWILNTGTRANLPLANPVVMTSDTTIYGNAGSGTARTLPFSGQWTVAGGSTLRIGNISTSSGNVFYLRLLAGDDITWPVVVGDPGFDAAGVTSSLQLHNDSTMPVQTVSGTISGNGRVNRSNGGTSIFTGDNTYAGGTFLDSGSIGIGRDSTPTSGTVTSGPLGTGLFETENNSNVSIFASGGARTIANAVRFNGTPNVVFTGTNALTFNGNVNLGNSAKILTVSNTAPVTFSGVMTLASALTKAGPGTLIFSGDSSTRSGTTTVNEGTLLINNTTGSGAGTNSVIVNSGGTLGGTGAIAGPVTVSSGGTLAAGASIGTLTINNDLTLDGVVAVEVNTSVNPSNDLISVSGVLTNTGGASVVVSNLGPILAINQKFTLFSAPVANGSAMPVSGGGANWTNNLEVDGSISVLSLISSVNTNPFTLGADVSGSNLNLSWPPDRLGWKVQIQTNALNTGLSNNWVTLPATAAVTNYTVPISSGDPAVFIRMVYP